MRLNSIRVKVAALIVLALLSIASASLVVSANLQRGTLIEATKRTLSTNTELLNRVVRDMMLSGEAPIAVNALRDLRDVQEFNDIAVYRIDGSNAFNDYRTVEFVNAHQKKYSFGKTPRMERSMTSDPNFRKVIETSMPLEYADLGREKSIEYYFPILNNQSECRFCHGTPPEVPFIRGIAHFKISVENTFNQIDSATAFLTAVFTGIAAAFTLLLIVFMRGLIILPLNRIGAAVAAIGQGDLEARVVLKRGDELGDLAAKLNEMIKGLNERFHLSKYVSRSTENHISSGAEGGQSVTKRATVLFSDIRGFTAYSEAHRPETVIEELNAILQVQAGIVESHGGDIDKFVGDELMAVFQDEYEAVACAVALVKAVRELDKQRGSGLNIGVGINSGEVISGNIGSSSRLEYAIIGDTVNLASRLCSIARRNMVLISSSVNDKVKDRVETALIAGQRIKGKAEAIDFYAVKALRA